MMLQVEQYHRASIQLWTAFYGGDWNALVLPFIVCLMFTNIYYYVVVLNY